MSKSAHRIDLTEVLTEWQALRANAIAKGHRPPVLSNIISDKELAGLSVETGDDDEEDSTPTPPTQERKPMAATQTANNINSDALLADPAIDRELRKILFNTPTPRNQTVSNSNQTAREKWDAIVAKLKTQHAPARAVSMAVKQHPDLHEAMLTEHNAQFGGR